MVDGLTEGQLFYLREEYKQALPKLKEELELALQLDAHGIDPEIEDPRVHKTLILSLEGERLAFDGQPGVLDFMRRMILEREGEEVGLQLLSVLEESSNEGVQFIAGMLQTVIEEGPSQIRHPRGIDPYRTASATLDTQSLFLMRFGRFLLRLDGRWHISSKTLKQAIALNSEARAGFEEGTPSYALTLMNEANTHRQLAERGKNPTENLTEAVRLYSEAKASFEEGTSDYARTLVNEANAHVQLAERGKKPTENLIEAIRLYSEAKAGFNEGTPDYARTLMNEANAHQVLAERGQDPTENLTEAIALNNKARAGFEEGTSDHAHTFVNEATAHRQLAERGHDPIENFTEAIGLYSEAKAGFKEGTPAYARAVMNEANAHQGLAERGQDPTENLTEAIGLYSEAKAGFEGSTPAFARAVMNEANAHVQLAERGKKPTENLTEAIGLYSEARAGFEEDTPDYARTLMNEANAHVQLAERGQDPTENLTEAIALNNKARAGFEEGTSDHAHTFVNEATAHRQLAKRGQDPTENLTEAIALCSEARACFEEDMPDYAHTLAEEANTRHELANLGQNPTENLTEAIALYSEAIAGFEEGTPSYALTLMNEANAHVQLAKQGQNSTEILTKAIALFSEAKACFEEGTPRFAHTLTHEAIAHYELAKREQNPTETLTEALALCGEARACLEGGTPDYARTLMNEANAHLGLAGQGQNPIENFTEVIALNSEARTGFEEGTPSFARTLMNEATAHQALAESGLNPESNYAEAEVLYTDARELFDASMDYESLCQVNTNLAGLYRSLGDLEKAFESYESAIEAIEEMRETVRLRDNREEFFTKHISVYHSTVLLALTLDKSEEALKYAERAKGRIFLDQLADTQVTGDIPEELAEQEQELKEQIAQLRRELDRDGRGIGDLSATGPAGVGAMSGGADAASQAPMLTAGAQSGRHRRLMRDIQLSDDVEAVVEAVEENREEKEAELKEARRDLEEVQANIQEHDPEAYTLRSVDVASLGEIRAGLGTDEQLLEYFVTDEKLVIFLVDNQELATEVVSLEERGPAGSLESVIDVYRMLAKLKDEGEVDRWQELGKELYELLIEPVEEELHSEDLTIVPHGRLHVVPFAALYDGESYLVERYKLRVLANASTLRFLDGSGDDEPEDVLVVGDPREESDDPDLAHARREAETVAELYDTEALIGPEARKEVVKERIETADLAHLACHAEYDTDEPAHSSVVLADTDLLLADLFKLEMEGELVTLAACETAYGEVSRGDEVQSLTRGFQYAGASGVIGTLWRVADEDTPELFREFYTADGNRAERLRQAQLSFIQAEDLRAHPYFWSGFQFYGIS